LRLIEALEAEQRALERELSRFARADRRCLALQTIFGVGPILACHLLASVRPAASAAPAKSSASPDSTPASTSQPTPARTASWPRPARQRFVGRSSKPPSPPANAAPTGASTPPSAAAAATNAQS
jgi:hypothetical protein